MKNVLFVSAWFGVVFTTQKRIKFLYGDVYEGQVNGDGNLDGDGVYTWNGGVFVGKYKDGWKVNGKHTYTNGNMYEGEYEMNKKNGHGVFTWARTWKYPPQIYDGHWKDNKRDGFGVFRTKADNYYMYVGDWKNDKRHGLATEKKGGVTYTGHFEDDKKNGEGTLRKKNGDVLTGKWKNDEPFQVVMTKGTETEKTKSEFAKRLQIPSSKRNKETYKDSGAFEDEANEPLLR